MAAGHIILDSYKTTQVTGPTSQVDIEYITAETTPTGIGYNYAMYYGTWTAGPPYTALDQIDALLESLVTGDYVVAGTAVQDLDNAALLTDFCDLVVSLDRSAQNLGPLTGTVRIPMSTIEAWAIDPNIAEAAGLIPPSELCANEYHRLQALAAS